MLEQHFTAIHLIIIDRLHMTF